jgi:hypothetical protein
MRYVNLHPQRCTGEACNLLRLMVNHDVVRLDVAMHNAFGVAEV